MAERALSVGAHFRIVGPDAPRTPGPPALILAPGRGFGDGSHPTTRLCLVALAVYLRQLSRPVRVLDFGAGNGVLSVAAGRMGATVEAVEIDAEACQEVRHNAALNGVAERITVARSLPAEGPPCGVVVANILCPVLIEHADALCARVAPDGYLVLSGLVATDAPTILAAYRPRLGAHRPQVHADAEWRAIVFAP